MRAAHSGTLPEKTPGHSGHSPEILLHLNTFESNRSRLLSDRISAVHGHQAVQPAPHISVEPRKICFPSFHGSFFEPEQSDPPGPPLSLCWKAANKMICFETVCLITYFAKTLKSCLLAAS